MPRLASCWINIVLFYQFLHITCAVHLTPHRPWRGSQGPAKACVVSLLVSLSTDTYTTTYGYHTRDLGCIASWLIPPQDSGLATLPHKSLCNMTRSAATSSPASVHRYSDCSVDSLQGVEQEPSYTSASHKPYIA
ncbi:hypothetical protein LZ30DRAFT_300692 [Colletotrichum cereale]|nr:hypothetical protein LZ30DRAFT_300692 [Colletotrichum cereale]